MKRLHRAASLAAVVVIIGGLLASAGALLPWMSLFGGLYPLRGVVGPNGWIVLTGGLLAATLGVMLLKQESGAAWRGAFGVGAALALFGAWIAVQLVKLTAKLQQGQHAMMVPERGAGIYVVLTGAVLIVAAALYGQRTLRTSSRVTAPK